MAHIYFRCQENTTDSPQEFVMEAPTADADWLEGKGYNVCGGPYEELLEAEFWLYGGPPCSVQLLDDLEEKEITWLLKRPELLTLEEKDYLNNYDIHKRKCKRK
jgi:hypothetical protein